ncbi:helix-turn-helix transcriptional regulator [Clostridium ganghwense]|uniref:Helix-turn-helix domain-containing protein n=1 Tax=Clostridium ganghwense TaxID=312089 RepID=A0ABT4CTN8_9CLOT|nr:helix-turn-helix domain-containing protein [Clostridium ganghwense]MCY6372414.1 helix-turn-helix domain-containing protein [Clostridium ganghwense]
MKNIIAKTRNKKNISQETLSKSVGISRPFLSNIENGKQIPSCDIAVRISKVLGEPIEKIFFEESVHNKEQKAI